MYQFSQYSTKYITSLRTFITYIFPDFAAETSLGSNYTERVPFMPICKVYPLKIKRSDGLGVISSVSSTGEVPYINIADTYFVGSSGYDDLYKVVTYNSDGWCGRVYYSKSALSSLLDNNFTDYSTYSQYIMYVPLYGFIDIDSYYIINSEEIICDYFIDVTSGECCVKIKCNIGNNGFILIKSLSVNISFDIPLFGIDGGVSRDSLLNLIPVAIQTAGLLTGHVYASTAASVVANNIINEKTSRTERNPKTNRQITAETSNITRRIQNDSTRTSISKHLPNYAGASITAFNGINDYVNRKIPISFSNPSGNVYSFELTGNGYIMAVRQRALYYNGFSSHFGRPLNKLKTLNEISGFTVISNIHLKLSCTSDESEEIEQLLKAGVIINNTSVPAPEIPPEPVQPTNPENPPEPEIPTETPENPTDTLPIPEGAAMLSPFNGKFRVTQTYHAGHQALDLVGEVDGTYPTVPQIIYSITSGVVERTAYQADGAGYYVRVRMTNGNIMYYMHMEPNSFKVTEGMSVETGTPLGIMGNTGNSTGAHTHLEMRKPDYMTSLDIVAYTGIPNQIGTYIGSPKYSSNVVGELQSSLGLENQTMVYLDNYKYSAELSSKILDKLK